MKGKLTLKSLLLLGLCTFQQPIITNAQSLRELDRKGSNFTQGDDDGDGGKQCSKHSSCCCDCKPILPKLKISAANYLGIKGIQDDNPSGFAQTYIQFDLTRKRNKGYCAKWDMLHNLFLQGYMSTNAGPLYSYKSGSGTDLPLVNRLDLYQHAAYKAIAHVNLVRFSTGVGELSDTDRYMSLYLDMIGAHMRTDLTDSTTKNVIDNLTSVALGASLTGTAHGTVFDAPFQLRLSWETFWINSMSNAVNADLNPQFAHLSDYRSTGSKPINLSNYPYHNLDATFKLQISMSDAANVKEVQASGNSDSTTADDAKKNTARNYVFFHLGYVSNFAGSSSQMFYNNYFSAQVGLEIDLVGSIRQLVSAKQ